MPLLDAASTAAHWLWHNEAAFYIAAYTLVGCALNYLVARIPGVPKAIIGGSPAWMTLMSMAYQLAYTVMMTAGAWRAATAGTMSREWWSPEDCATAQPAPMLQAPAGGAPGAAPPGDALWWERNFLYLMCGYMIKDLFQPMSALIYAHHVFCLVGVGIFLAGSCGGLAATSTWILEVGSFAYNAWVAWPRSPAAKAFYVVVHTASNGFAVWAMTHYLPHNGFSPFGAKGWGGFSPGGVFLAVTGAGLIAVRQWECYANVLCERSSAEEDGTKATTKRRKAE